MIKHPRVPDSWDLEVDLVSVGSSSGGLVAAMLGHDLGMSTVVLEKADSLGGGTALSGGAIWMPFNKHMHRLGIRDSREETLGYVRRVSMGHHDETILATYLDNCNPMLEWVEQNTPLKMSCENDASRTEYCADVPGGKPMGRKLWPNPEVMPQILAEAEKTQPMLAKVRKDPVKYLLGPRPPWVQGRALIGPLVLACVSRGINLLTNTRGLELLVRNGRVIGVRAQRDGRDFFVRASKGVLLATGGFEWNPEMNKRFIYAPYLHAYTAPSNEGDGHIMGMDVGAAVALMDHSIFQPGLHLPGEIMENGLPFARPFIYGYPGMILINRHGKRCCDECFYPDQGRAFIAYDRIKGEYANWPVFFICDQSFRDIFPIMTLRRGTELVDWIKKGDTVQALAEALGMSGNDLAETVERFNRFACEGRDPDFHRGESTYDRQWGEMVFPGRKPSSVLGPLDKPPFYGVKLGLTTAGNLGGLVTNANAQVIDVRGEVIPGLYCTSNTQAMLLLGHHYDSGAAQGKSMVFGYLAARHMARGGEKGK
jgi:3-oxosteroid 1-dehydrogenase